MKRNWLIHDDIWRYWLVFGGDVSVWGGTGWYLVVLGQYNLVLLGIKLKKKSGDLVGCYHSGTDD